MPAITASMVAELRAKTDAPLMECKKALTEAEGDFERAEEILRVKLGNKAGKAAARITAEGVVAASVQGSTGALVEINCETDFVSTNDSFLALANACAKLVADNNPADARHNTFFQVLPTPRVYARFPFYNLMNNEDTFLQFRLKPHRMLSVRADLRYLRLSNKNDLWYLGGGAFQKNTFGYIGRPSGGKDTLGTLGDLSMDFNVTPTTAITFYVAGVSGGSVQRFVYPEGGTHPGARLLYFEITQRF